MRAVARLDCTGQRFVSVVFDRVVRTVYQLGLVDIEHSILDGSYGRIWAY